MIWEAAKREFQWQETTPLEAGRESAEDSVKISADYTDTDPADDIYIAPYIAPCIDPQESDGSDSSGDDEQIGGGHAETPGPPVAQAAAQLPAAPLPVVTSAEVGPVTARYATAEDGNGDQDVVKKFKKFYKFLGSRVVDEDAQPSPRPRVLDKLHSRWDSFMQSLKTITSISDELINRAIPEPRQLGQLGETPLLYAIRLNAAVNVYASKSYKREFYDAFSRTWEEVTETRKYKARTVLDELFSKGADPNICRIKGNIPPLVYALLMGEKRPAFLDMLPDDLREEIDDPAFPTFIETDLIGYLLGQGANPNIMFNGKTLLELAVAADNKAAVYFITQAITLPSLLIRPKGEGTPTLQETYRSLGLSHLRTLYFQWIGQHCVARNIEKAIRARVMHWDRVEKGQEQLRRQPLSIILAGMPGCGKTEITKSLGHIITNGDPDRYFYFQIQPTTTGEMLFGKPTNCGGDPNGPALVQHLRNCHQNGDTWREKVNVVVLDEFEKGFFESSNGIFSGFQLPLGEGMCKNAACPSEEPFPIPYTIFIFVSNQGEELAERHSVEMTSSGYDKEGKMMEKNERIFKVMGTKIDEQFIKLIDTVPHGRSMRVRLVVNSKTMTFGVFLDNEIDAICQLIVRRVISSIEGKDRVEVNEESLRNYGKSKYKQNIMEGYSNFLVLKDEVGDAIANFEESGQATGSRVCIWADRDGVHFDS
jgi:hypothetical protein